MIAAAAAAVVAEERWPSLSAPAAVDDHDQQQQAKANNKKEAEEELVLAADLVAMAPSRPAWIWSSAADEVGNRYHITYEKGILFEWFIDWVTNQLI